MPEVRSPTVRRRELGALLRALRNEKGLTVEQVAERLLCSTSKVSRMETGQGITTPRDIRDLCDLYQVTDAERDRMQTLAREGKRRAWWQSYDLAYANKFPITPGEWYLMQIRVEGPRAMIRVNGETVAETDQLIVIRPGHVALQMHKRGAWVRFQDIKLKVLPE